MGYPFLEVLKNLKRDKKGEIIYHEKDSYNFVDGIALCNAFHFMQ